MAKIGKPKVTHVELDFPSAPDFNNRGDRQQNFEQWYYELQTSLKRQFEELSSRIDELENKTQS
jgi:hypothetical protein